ncbi:YlbD family protein [Oceanobacillus chungangensis]|uniref:Cytosolic protein n=1 Tax=Oceanobacillus chungangensis TaxID=1229152 RepID=A0A3D8PPA2_9BACI|nr:spore coat protein YlbD [Oceanobacillus chungangensis]RDW17946.1 hypothetical protein CWR45_11480 [Oceanobacillus chungangensis]
MEVEHLNPTVLAFKEFINAHPSLIKEVRKSGKSWQEYYEKWVLLGEDDPHWEQYKEEPTKENEKKSDEKNFELMSQLMKLTENFDINKVQGQVQQLSNTISTIQEVISQYQQSKKPSEQTKDPFNWFHD